MCIVFGIKINDLMIFYIFLGGFFLILLHIYITYIITPDFHVHYNKVKTRSVLNYNDSLPSNLSPPIG